MRAPRHQVFVMSIFLFGGTAYAESPSLATAVGIVEKFDNENLTVFIGYASEKAMEVMEFKITNTTTFTLLTPQVQEGRTVFTQKTVAVSGLAKGQSVAVIYASIEKQRILLNGVVRPVGWGQEVVATPRAKIEFRWIEDHAIKDVTEENGVIAWEDDLMYLHKDAILTSKDIADAILCESDLTANGIGVVYSVRLILTEGAKEKLAMTMEKSGAKRLAVVVDGNIRGATCFKDKAMIEANIPSAGFLSSKFEAERIVQAAK